MTSIANNNTTYSPETITEVKKGLVSWVAQLELTLNQNLRFDNLVDPKSTQKSQKKVIFDRYTKFMKQFEDIDFDLAFFVHCSILFRRVMERRKPESNLKDLLYVFASCLFISLKYVADDTICFISEFAEFTGLEKKKIEILEQGILIDVLDFNVHVPAALYEQELNYLQTLTATF